MASDFVKRVIAEHHESKRYNSEREAKNAVIQFLNAIDANNKKIAELQQANADLQKELAAFDWQPPVAGNYGQE